MLKTDIIIRDQLEKYMHRFITNEPYIIRIYSISARPLFYSYIRFVPPGVFLKFAYYSH